MNPRNFPKPYFATLDTPLIYFGKRLLQPKQQTSDTNNYAEFYSKRFALEEIVTPKKLESLYFRHNSDVFERFQQEFIETYFEREFKTRAELSASFKQNKVLALIVEKVIPTITSVNLENRIGTLIREDNDSSNRRTRRQNNASSCICRWPS